MSYGLNPIAVDLDAVRAILGSGDRALLRLLTDESRNRIEQLDRSDDPDADASDRAIPAGQALRQMILGEPLSTSWLDSVKYAYMFEKICCHFGEELPNGEWSSVEGDWFDVVDEALEETGVDAKRFRMVGFVVHRGMPVALPTPDDFPAIGYVLRGELREASAALEGIELPDLEVRAAVEQARSWLESCGGSGRDLVCFYY